MLESPIVGVVRSRSRCDFGIMLLPPATPSSLRMGSFIFGALEREVWVPHPHPGAAPTMALLPHPHPQHGKARAVCENERLGNCGCGMWLSKMAPTLTPRCHTHDMEKARAEFSRTPFGHVNSGCVHGREFGLCVHTHQKIKNKSALR